MDSWINLYSSDWSGKPGIARIATQQNRGVKPFSLIASGASLSLGHVCIHPETQTPCTNSHRLRVRSRMTPFNASRMAPGCCVQEFNCAIYAPASIKRAIIVARHIKCPAGPIDLQYEKEHCKRYCSVKLWYMWSCFYSFISLCVCITSPARNLFSINVLRRLMVSVMMMMMVMGSAVKLLAINQHRPPCQPVGWSDNGDGKRLITFACRQRVKLIKLDWVKSIQIQSGDGNSFPVLQCSSEPKRFIACFSRQQW